ncbi:MAG: hypothetical protein AAF251_13770 [Pseudomonadota bacterium]
MSSQRITKAIAQLRAKSKPDRLAKIADLASQASSAAEERNPPLDPILDELEALTGERQDEGYWRTFHGGEGPEAYAEMVGEPMPETIHDLDSDEIRALLELHEAVGGEEAYETDTYDNAILDRCHRYLDRCLGKAWSNDLVYYRSDELGLNGLVEEILKLRALLREGGMKALKDYEYNTALELRLKLEDMPWLEDWLNRTLAPGSRDVYATIPRVLSDAQDFWWIIGGVAANLHGCIPEPLKEVEVLVSARDFEALSERLPIAVRRDARHVALHAEAIGEWSEPEMSVVFLTGLSLGEGEEKEEYAPKTRVMSHRYSRENPLYVPERQELMRMLSRTRQWLDWARVEIMRAQDKKRMRERRD